LQKLSEFILEYSSLEPLVQKSSDLQECFLTQCRFNIV
jgi:hypothetical protein